MIHPFHLAIFAILLFGGTLFATLVVNFTTDMGFIWSALKVVNKLAKSLAFRQSLALMVAIGFVRYGLEPLVKSVRSVFSLPGQWERSTEFFILQQVCMHTLPIQRSNQFSQLIGLQLNPTELSDVLRKPSWLTSPESYFSCTKCKLVLTRLRQLFRTT